MTHQRRSISSGLPSNERPIRDRHPPKPIYQPLQSISSSTRPKRTLHQPSVPPPPPPPPPPKPVDSLGRTRHAAAVLSESGSNIHYQNGHQPEQMINHQYDQLPRSDDKDAEGEEDDEEEQPELELELELNEQEQVDEDHQDSYHPEDSAESGSEYKGEKELNDGDRSSQTDDHLLSDASSVIKKPKANRVKIIESSDEAGSQSDYHGNGQETHDLGDDDEGYEGGYMKQTDRQQRSTRKKNVEKLAKTRSGANGTNGAVRRSTRGHKVPDYESESGPAPNTQEEEEKRTLRTRSKPINYHIPPFQALEPDENSRSKKDRRGKDVRLRLHMSGKELDQVFGQARPGHDSDEEPTGAFGGNNRAGAGILGGATGSTGLLGGPMLDPGNLGGGGGPSNLGKMSGSTNLADTDPLGVQTNIDFSQVGGMDQHIQQLKEMVSLPLLYPEVFQRFQITPPRGVLFHGPPGTGKTLLARALAASCSSEGQKIAFFMRKGADCLSKWVGEAERQLRILFEEAKNCQPSIIFFDEIDGLAPVRSSKQDQIHASIVSTLLSLMDGMDGRGQVVVIGATNRPDAIDPALRRPGRFDREFYFPLPDRKARLSIINIHTRGWDPPLEDTFKSELADLTKGYGGADLRALCTEAAMNAVQRRYPQIYKSTDRLVIDPKNIDVVARDFTIAQKHLIPSTSRSSSSVASPLPVQLQPLLERWLVSAKKTLGRMLPEIKKPNVLEEAEYEDDVGGGGFEREKMIQSFETLRVFRPRMVISGPKGCGQSYIGSAILHHLEGYHVQVLDLANLISDSTISPDARCVQIFNEAKRHKPSVIYIPSLHNWDMPLLEGVRPTIGSLLDELKSSDPILLLGVVDCPFEQLPRSLRSWFGITQTNRIVLEPPSPAEREKFFADTISSVQRPPNEFPDGLPRKKRVLEVLAKAPPRAPRVPTQAELDSHLTQDQRMVEYLKFRLGPVLNELKKKHKRFTKPVGPDPAEVARINEEAGEGGPQLQYNPVDLESMHYKLYYSKYLTSHQFIADVEKIVRNAELDCHLSVSGETELAVKAQAMLTHTKIMVEQACDQQFEIDCGRMFERMKLREAGRKKKEKEKQKEKGREEPVRTSGRTSGRDPEFAYDPDLNERGLKRIFSVEDVDEQRPQKRSRAEEDPSVEGNGHEVEGEQVVGRSTSPDYEPGEAPPGSGPQHAGLSLANLLNHHDGPSFPSSASVQNVSDFPKEVTDQVESVAATSSMPNGPAPQFKESDTMEIESPAPAPLPDFVLQETELEQLRSFLVNETEGLVVDELEELRASCYETVWRRRGEWDRGVMVVELINLAGSFLNDVKWTRKRKNEEEDGDEN
ncbi:hypothetical protein CROQUDRAFT_652646 [Cronartium quercuum f. sp. fusiforme G11]|uniref:AAA+ ATPase domain-containing protein n=1 Tax=Cronartium quercuum f. sp. fusiforme G11 TaxID=708437 RepID=A0A9P6NN58_9BASI|nr:hypothetical protein CROQUDRAFT_652646 [Cronartium quercuum f. sp. fusiforme G11]